MPKDDYSSAAGGGLRLKGVNPSSKISKHKKKRSKAPPEAEKVSAKPEPEALEKANEQSPKENGNVSLDGAEADKSGDEIGEGAMARGKTQAELQHEERRRRRVCDSSALLGDTVEDSLLILHCIQLEERLKREGTKTHKERVEEFNHYLSNLSEHHDMPRIGPG
ncbi:MAG: hypothetical protein LQ352_004535 [Teloschistes flavicans]|nr:MAG: hypothetical protein LQ352_004535 [Teloschistes flavicans]